MLGQQEAGPPEAGPGAVEASVTGALGLWAGALRWALCLPGLRPQGSLTAELRGN